MYFFCFVFASCKNLSVRLLDFSRRKKYFLKDVPSSLFSFPPPIFSLFYQFHVFFLNTTSCLPVLLGGLNSKKSSLFFMFVSKRCMILYEVHSSWMFFPLLFFSLSFPPISLVGFFGVLGTALIEALSGLQLYLFHFFHFLKYGEAFCTFNSFLLIMIKTD